VRNGHTFLTVGPDTIRWASYHVGTIPCCEKTPNFFVALGGMHNSLLVRYSKNLSKTEGANPRKIKFSSIFGGGQIEFGPPNSPIFGGAKSVWPPQRPPQLGRPGKPCHRGLRKKWFAISSSKTTFFFENKNAKTHMLQTKDTEAGGVCLTHKNSNSIFLDQHKYF